MSDDHRIKVIVDGIDSGTKVFVAEGDSVAYTRNTNVEQRPRVAGWSYWPRRIVTKHTLTWETETYE